MGVPKRGTDVPFNITKVATKIEGSPKSGKSDNKKGKGKNGGSNDTSPASARTAQLVPPDTGSYRGNKSRRSSFSNTPTSSPQTCPEANLRGVRGLLSRGVKAGSTDTEDRECSSKQSITTSPHTSPPQLQPSSLQESSPPQARKPIPQPTGEPNTTTALQGKQENGKPVALPTFDLPTPPTSPEIQSQTMPVALEDGPAPSLLGSPSGLADMDKQDDVKPAALLSSSPLTPPASPRTQNLAVPANLENGPASSNSLPENASGLAELKDKQDDVKPAALLSSDPPTTPASPAVPADLEDRPAPSLLKTASVSPDKDPQDDVKSAALPSSKSCHYCF